MIKSWHKALAALVILAPLSIYAEDSRVKWGGEVRVRWYEEFDERDNAWTDYGRYRARLRATGRVTRNVYAYAGLSSGTDEGLNDASRYAGRPQQQIKLYNAFANLRYRNLWIVKGFNFRAGKQYYKVGRGLVVGTWSAFDGAKLTLDFPLDIEYEAFGARYQQTLTRSLATNVDTRPGLDSSNFAVNSVAWYFWDNEIRSYYLYDDAQGDYNSSRFYGAYLNLGMRQALRELLGIKRSSPFYFTRGFRLEYEFAYQDQTKNPGIPRNERFEDGMAHLGTLSYRFYRLSILRRLTLGATLMKVTGDDESTTEIEMFNPKYSKIFLANRTLFTTDTVSSITGNQSNPLINRTYYGVSVGWAFEFLRSLSWRTRYLIGDKTLSSDFDENDIPLRNEFDFNVDYYFARRTLIGMHYTFRHATTEDWEFDVRNSSFFKYDHQLRAEFKVTF